MSWFFTFFFLFRHCWPYLFKRKDDKPLYLTTYVFPQYLLSILSLVQFNICNYCWLHSSLSRRWLLLTSLTPFSLSVTFPLLLQFEFCIFSIALESYAFESYIVVIKRWCNSKQFYQRKIHSWVEWYLSSPSSSWPT